MFKSPTAAPMITLAGLGLLLAACGGGGNSGISANDGEVFGLTSTSITTRALPAEEPKRLESVQLEGCVVDSQWLSAAGVAVHVVLADGRAVGTAYTNAQGVFALKVPARSALVLSTDWAAPGAMMLNTGSQAMSASACLPANP